MRARVHHKDLLSRLWCLTIENNWQEAREGQTRTRAIHSQGYASDSSPKLDVRSSYNVIGLMP